MPGCLFGNMALEISTRDEVLRAKLNAVFQKASSRFHQTLDEAVEQLKGEAIGDPVVVAKMQTRLGMSL